VEDSFKAMAVLPKQIENNSRLLIISIIFAANYDVKAI